MTLQDTTKNRQEIIDACMWLNAQDVNHGTSGNVSLRVGDSLLITPSATPYDEMTPDMICCVPLQGPPDPALQPSTEWQFHQAVFQAREDVHAIVHAHPTYATAVAIAQHEIPAIHYMIAAFGGPNIPLADYALFGSAALARAVAQALAERHGCLMANHGALTTGDTLVKALWRMKELEILAHQYILTDFGARAQILTSAQVEEAMNAFDDYGVRATHD